MASENIPVGKRVVAVIGATGAQGGAVVRGLTTDDSFEVWALTRNPDSDKAKALPQKGVRVVQADVDDPEGLAAAIRGAYGVFGMTDFHSTKSQDDEARQGKNIAEACKRENIQHLVFSLLKSTTDLTGHVFQAGEGKARAEACTRQMGLPATFVYYEMYMENLFGKFKPLREEDGSYTLDFPMEGKPMPYIWVEESGECIRQIFLHRELYLGQSMFLSSETMTIEYIADIMTNILGRTFKATKMTVKECAKRPIPMDDDWVVMYEWFQIRKDCSENPARKLHPNIGTFEDFVRNHKRELLATLE